VLPPPTDELAALADAGLRRTLRTLEPLGPTRARTADGREVSLFCSNDYLGLADHPVVREAAAAAIRREGWGSGASRLVSGSRPGHSRLERALAAFKGAEAALVTPTGYQANLAALTAVAGPQDVVLLDKLNHACLIDGAKLSGARVRVYPHNDVEKLAALLAEPSSAEARRRWIVTDSVFSMDGDAARLPEIVALAERHSAGVLIDEAHGTGVLGRHGRGAAELLGVEGRVDLTVGTLSKALGGLGGFIAGRREWIELIVNRGRAFLFTTAPPAAQAAAAEAALSLVVSEPQRRERVAALAGRVRRAVAERFPGSVAPHTPEGSPIIPVILGPPERALAAAESLLSAGLLVPAIRPPTVPPGTSRLRISVSAAHSDDEVERLLTALGRLSA
jgi:8-amino-7-oxononanoate synthase